MSAAKYTYAVEAEHRPGQWLVIFDNETRDFCVGYFLGARTLTPPRLAKRVVRSDGEIVEISPAEGRVGLGQVVGHPTPEQYERAAARALETAKKLRAMRTKRSPRG